MYRFRSGKFQIRFADTAEPDLLLLAGQLINCFKSAEKRGLSLAQLESELSVSRRMHDAKTADGIVKLLCDRTEFSRVQDQDLPQLRKKVFSAVPGLLAECGGDFSIYRRKAAETAGENNDIYGDLPGFETIIKAPQLSASELLQRYNLALAQGMFFHAEKMSVKVSDPEPAELRRMLKYLKFFRLLGEVKKVTRSGIELDISGPYSLFGPTRKYALNLAVFFPAVVRLKKWSVSAELDIRGRKGILKLDESSGLVSHYRNFSAYVPEEVKMFHRLFGERSENWKIIGETPILNDGNQQFIIPDISFMDENGVTIHLELFHRWHKHQIQQRLETLKHGRLPLIAGIDRSIMDDAEFEKLVSENPELKDRIFRFSDFPGVERVQKMLDRQL